MTNNQLNHLLNFIKKTGDQAIVLDPSGSDQMFAVVPFDRYEKLVADNAWLPDERLDGDDDDSFFDPAIADNSAATSGDVVIPDWDNNLPNTDLNIDEVTEREESPPVEGNDKKNNLSFSEDWAEQNTAPTTEESLSDIPHEEEEEKFYLEPVE